MAYLTTSNVLGRPQVPVVLTSDDWAKFLGATAAPTPFMYPGGRVIAYDPIFGEAEFVLAYGVASLQIGDAVRIGLNYATTRTVASIRGLIGISMSANTSTTALSWFCVRGQVPVRAAAAIAADTPLFVTATAGSLDDAVVAGDNVVGAMAVSASGATVGTKVCNTVNGSTELVVPDLNGLYVGMAVSGTGIAASSTISAIGYGGNMLGVAGPKAGRITLNNAMNATGQATITFAHPATFATALVTYPVCTGAV